jgi:hypothetical protein
MKFLVISKPKHLVPPEVTVGLIDAINPWLTKFSANFEQAWGFAGIQGGGGILDVNSLDELDTVVGSFPMLGTSDVEVIPLVDLKASLERAKQAISATGK